MTLQPNVALPYTHKVTVDSSFIEKVLYDEVTATLFIVYKYHNNHRAYEGVQYTLFNEFVTAPSAGGFYNREIKNNGYNSFYFTEDELGDRYYQAPNMGNPSVMVNASSLAVNAGVTDTQANPYTVSFVVGGVEGVFNVDADNDVNALQKFTDAVANFGFDYTLQSVTRTFV